MPTDFDVQGFSKRLSEIAGLSPAAASGLVALLEEYTAHRLATKNDVVRLKTTIETLPGISTSELGRAIRGLHRFHYAQITQLAFWATAMLVSATLFVFVAGSLK